MKYYFNGPDFYTTPDGDNELSNPHTSIRVRRQGESASKPLTHREELELDHPFSQEYSAKDVAMSAVDALRNKEPFRIHDIPVPPSQGEHRAADARTPRVIN